MAAVNELLTCTGLVKFYSLYPSVIEFQFKL